MSITVNNRSNPKITAKTIIAGNAPSIVADNAAPINKPITIEKAVNNIIATISKQFLFLEHLSSLLS